MSAYPPYPGRGPIPEPFAPLPPPPPAPRRHPDINIWVAVNVWLVMIALLVWLMAGHIEHRRSIASGQAAGQTATASAAPNAAAPPASGSSSTNQHVWDKRDDAAYARMTSKANFAKQLGKLRAQLGDDPVDTIVVVWDGTVNAGITDKTNCGIFSSDSPADSYSIPHNPAWPPFPYRWSRVKIDAPDRILAQTKALGLDPHDVNRIEFGEFPVKSHKLRWKAIGDGGRILWADASGKHVARSIWDLPGSGGTSSGSSGGSPPPQLSPAPHGSPQAPAGKQA